MGPIHARFMNPRYRSILIAAIALSVVWLLALGGFYWARGSKPTAARVSGFLGKVHLAELEGEARASALARLAALLNALPAEERRKARMERLWQPWFDVMSDDERIRFIEATAPTGFQQMLSSFEQLPEDRRRTAIGDAFRRLREAGGGLGDDSGPGDAAGTNSRPMVLSDELRDRVAQIGLKAYYSQSSARTKAEMAPLMEEIQVMMEGGRIRRGPPRAVPK